MRDLAAGTTSRVSIGIAGQEANDDCENPALSQDGQFVAFTSAATNLVSGDSNGSEDLFVRELTTAQIWRYESTYPGFPIQEPLLSDDGRFLFAVCHDAGGPKSTVRIDRQTGVRASVPRPPSALTISGDAGVVTSEESSYGLGLWYFGPPTSVYAIYGWPPFSVSGNGDLVVYGDLFSLRWIRFSSGTGGNIAGAPWQIQTAAISNDGDIVLYGTNNIKAYWVTTGSSRSVAYSTGRPVMSQDARLIAYESGSDTLVPGDTNGAGDVFVYDWFLTVYPDSDGDGFGAASGSPSRRPMLGQDWSTNNLDCDDQTATVHPGAPDVCNLVDDDCDGIVDNGLQSMYWPDYDSDGYGDSSAPAILAACPSPQVSSNNLDCDDSDPFVHPGAPDLCDGVDNNCDGVIDEGFVTSYCTAGTTVAGCVPAIRGEGAPSSLATSGFDIVVDNVPTQKMGLIFYGLGAIPSPQPWGLGSSSYLCIYYPVNRTGAHNSGGSVGACDGELRVDWNAWRTASPAAIGSPFAAGQALYAQGWFRDSGAAKGTNLSDGLMFTLCE